jgi:hypothetical protein
MITNEMIRSKKFRLAAGVVGVLLIALISFAAGIRVGIRKARFSYAFGQNYERNFAGPHHRGSFGFPPPDVEDRGFRNAHGISGTIISITDSNIVIKDQNNNENTVAIQDKTIIKNGRDDIKITDLKNDERIVVIGQPGDNGVINADLIRVFENNQNPNPQN